MPSGQRERQGPGISKGKAVYRQMKKIKRGKQILAGIQREVHQTGFARFLPCCHIYVAKVMLPSFQHVFLFEFLQAGKVRRLEDLFKSLITSLKSISQKAYFGVATLWSFSLLIQMQLKLNGTSRVFMQLYKIDMKVKFSFVC